TGGAGPMLINTGLEAEEIETIAHDGKAPGMPGGTFAGSDEELKELAEFIASLKEEE
ncbi:MAG TPA: cytochrome c, partial [Metalysinibacillus jejuensis]|nr:cytochrome c [Metalysinibacillus jejuensis]